MPKPKDNWEKESDKKLEHIFNDISAYAINDIDKMGYVNWMKEKDYQKEVIKSFICTQRKKAVREVLGEKEDRLK